MDKYLKAPVFYLSTAGSFGILFGMAAMARLVVEQPQDFI